MERYCNGCQKYLTEEHYSKNELRLFSDYPCCKRCNLEFRRMDTTSEQLKEERVCLKCDKVRNMGPRDWICDNCKAKNRDYRTDGNFDTVY